jgi:hypothetical protein
VKSIPDTDYQALQELLQFVGGYKGMQLLLNAFRVIHQATGYGQITLEIDHRQMVQLNETVKRKPGK